MRKHVLLAMLLSGMLAGCSSLNGGVIEGTAVQICRTWKPVFTSKDDKLTDDTVRQIVGNNEANRHWCGDSGPPPKAPVKTS